MPTPQLLKIGEAARAMRLSEARTWELVHSGELRSLKIGRSRRIRVDDLLEFLDAHSDATRGGAV